MGGLDFCIRGTPPRKGVRGWEGGRGRVGGSEHPRLAEVVPDCLAESYDTRSESSGIFYNPIPAGGRTEQPAPHRLTGKCLWKGKGCGGVGGLGGRGEGSARQK